MLHACVVSMPDVSYTCCMMKVNGWLTELGLRQPPSVCILSLLYVDTSVVSKIFMSIV